MRELPPMQRPPVRNKILAELGMLVLVFNLPVCFEEHLDLVRVPSRLDPAAHIVILQGKFLVLLILNNHIVKNHTSSHDVVEVFLFLETSWTPNNCKPGLQHPKRSFDVFAGCFLAHCKMTFLWVFWSIDGLDKCCPLRINAIS